MLNGAVNLYSAEDNELMAEEIGLRYVCDRDAGFTRKRRGKSFYYVDHQNNKVSHDATLHRIRSLVLPPAWEAVWICKHANGHLQATGRDARMRKQYRYHNLWNEHRNETKFSRLANFGDHLCKIRDQIERDLKSNDLSREMVLAAVLRIMEETMIRVGNDAYAEENDSYGLTTIRNDHAHVRGEKTRFQFRGKSGVERDVTLHDKRLSRIIKQCQDLPGQELFAYVNEDGSVCDVGSEDVNRYLKQITGEAMTAKDFRTWGGTVRGAKALFEMGPAEKDTEREFKKRHLETYRNVSAYLGNTVAVCRKYYVHPAVLEADRDGRLFDAFQKAQRKHKRLKSGNCLSPDELAVLEILNQP